MPKYSYNGINARYKYVSGFVQALTVREAASQLRQTGMTIITLQEEREVIKQTTSPKQSKGEISLSFNRIKGKDQVAIFRQMISLLAAGISIVPTIAILENQMTKKSVKRILGLIRLEVERGKPLSVAMEQYPRIFNKLVTSLIKTGESTGLLDEAILQIVEHLEKKQELKKQVIASLMYPMIVLLVTMGVVGFLVGSVIPKIIPLLEVNGAELPWNTLALMSATEYLQNNWYNLLIKLVVSVVGIILLRKIPVVRYYSDRYKLRLPLIGPILKYSAIVSFTRTLSILLASGVSIVTALRETANTISNKAVKKVISEIAESVLAGETFSNPIKKAAWIFPPMVESLIKIGEETGSIDSSLKTIASFFQELLAGRIKTMNTIIEPFLILLMSGLVGFVAWGLIGGMLAGYGA